MNPTPAYRLYHYWRSSSSWRVRIALDYKSLPYESIPISLISGESSSESHHARSPGGTVPVLEIPGIASPFLTESLAILHYLEESHPERPSLFQGNPLKRARIRELSETINSGTHPIQNIHVLRRFSADIEEQKKWAHDFIADGLAIYESLCKKTAGLYSVGDEPSIADCCLIPQLYNAERFSVDLSPYPTLQGIQARCQLLGAFQSSHPDRYKPFDFKG